MGMGLGVIPMTWVDRTLLYRGRRAVGDLSYAGVGWGWGYNPYISGVGTVRVFSTLAVRMGRCFSCPGGDDGAFLCLADEDEEFLLMTWG